MKVYIALATALVVCGILVKDNIDKRLEVKELKQTITNANNAEKESVKTITKIREVVKNVQEPCDCYNQPVPNDIIELLRN